MIKEFKSGDGCRFMCTCLPGSTSVFDMDVDDGVEVVEFEKISRRILVTSVVS